MKTITLPKFPTIEFSNDLPFVLIAGPCAMESPEHAIWMATQLQQITMRVGIPFVFKTSFDKANRTSINSPRGVGLKNAKGAFKFIREHLEVPVLTDIHTPSQCKKLDGVVDIIQIPAFLTRQTDLVVAAGETDCVVNIKKAQFMSPQDVVHVIKKVESTRNTNILLTDRGTCFGYNTLVSDMRGLVSMSDTGYPVVFDATHSVQQPSAGDGKSSGQREMVFPLARAATAVGVASLFMEVHENPDEALSDGPNMLRLDEVEDVLTKLLEIDRVVKLDV